MNYLDIIILIFLLWAAFRGFTKGFIIAVASLIALILGIYAGIHFSDFAAYLIVKWFGPETRHLTIIAFIITFIAVVILVHVIAWLTDKLVKAVALGFINRLLGVIFNSIKMAFILSVIISILNYFNAENHIIPEKDRESSILYYPVAAIAPAVFPYLRFEKIRINPPEITPAPKKHEILTLVQL